MTANDRIISLLKSFSGLDEYEFAGTRWDCSYKDRYNLYDRANKYGYTQKSLDDMMRFFRRDNMCEEVTQKELVWRLRDRKLEKCDEDAIVEVDEDQLMRIIEV